MPGTRSDLNAFDCGVAQTAGLIGDGWTILILRDLFMGLSRYEEFAAHLKISSKVLADRLQRLADNGVVERVTDPQDARAADYRLTEKGLDLYPFIYALNEWGETWMGNGRGRRQELRDRLTGQPLKPAGVYAEDGRRLGPFDVSSAPGPGVGDVYRDAQALIARRKGRKLPPGDTEEETP